MQNETGFVCINDVHPLVLVANRTLNSEQRIDAHRIQVSGDTSTITSFGELQLLDTLLLVKIRLLVWFEVHIELRLIIYDGDGPVFKLGELVRRILIYHVLRGLFPMIFILRPVDHVLRLPLIDSLHLIGHHSSKGIIIIP